MPKKNVLVVFGTRPEALKLAPLVLELQRSSHFKVLTCLTAQHRHMVDQVLQLFSITPDVDLDLMEKGQSLARLTAKIFDQMNRVLIDLKPSVVIVQGDTTTSFAAALNCFYLKIPVAHVEAGLRTYDKFNPFPEEINRVLISKVSDYHFAPTKAASANLIAEGTPRDRVYVTGNTVVDALTLIAKHLGPQPNFFLNRRDKKIILMTAHRRESFGGPMHEMFQAMKQIVSICPDVEIVYPVHLNPSVQQAAEKILKNTPRIHLLTPLNYIEFLAYLKHCYLVLTDSGGVQEEAPSFRKPVLVMRKVSERMEGVNAGVSKLVGTKREDITRETVKLLRNENLYKKMTATRNPYGDGKASRRIVDLLKKVLLK